MAINLRANRALPHTERLQFAHFERLDDSLNNPPSEMTEAHTVDFSRET
jgi:hypothetical protein